MTSQLLLRRRLINALNDSRDHIAYIYAPTGYGKTVLAQQWAESQSDPVVWINGVSNQDLRDLFRTLVLAIKKKVPSVSRKLAKFESIEDVNQEVIVQFLNVFLKDKNNFCIVIDDAESIRQEHNEFARYLVGNLPSHIRLILITETLPRTSFLNMYGADRFTMISPSELQFTLEELEQLGVHCGIDLTKGNLEELNRLTLGWPLGTHIAISQLALTKDFKGLLSSIKNTGHDQFTIPAQRILASLQSHELELLTELSLLESIEAQSAIALTSTQDAIRVLTTLSQESMVVTQTRFAPPVFAIHPLFRRVLINDFQRHAQFQDKLERLITFLLTNGQIRDLTTILLELGSIERLSALLQDQDIACQISQSVYESIHSARIDQLENWIEVTNFVPKVGAIQKEVLCFYLELLRGNFRQVESTYLGVKVLIAGLNLNDAEIFQKDLLALESILAFIHGDLSRCFDTAMKANNHQATGYLHSGLNSLLFLQFALLSAFIKDDDLRVKKIAQVLSSFNLKNPSVNQNALIHSMYALIAAHQGRLTEARNELALPFPTIGESYKGFFAPYAVHLSEVFIVAETQDHERSVKLLDVALQHALAAQNYPIATYVLGRLAYQLVMAGDTDEALNDISKSRDLITQNSLSEELHSALDIWEARVRYWLMDYKRAEDLLSRTSDSYLINAFKAGILMSQGNNAKALEITEGFNLQIPRQKLTYHLYRAHIFSDSPTRQYKEVREAVEVGSKHGYFKHLLTQRSDVIQQYISLVAEYPTPYTERLAKAAGERLYEMMQGGQDPSRSLTRREADILRHLGTGMAIKQIASDLCISKNTMKTHLKSIYRKLGAANRQDAIEKGKKLLKV